MPLRASTLLPVLLAFGVLSAAPAAQAQIAPRPDRPPPPRLERVTPRTYPLLCRGTRSLNVWVRPERVALLMFERSAGPASAGLAPGQCAWMDRAVRADEPARLAHHVPAGADGEAPYQWPEVLYDPDRYWVFEVYNNGRGDLVVTASREQPR
ncbi:MAG: hypothetical protein KY467_08860 [Gemmatimonadetes bacterium]|nr:hypothetical protein [Gemmatimonadota bacterium]